MPASAPCRWCGLAHGPLCPRVKALELDAQGVNVIRVEFFAPNEYPQSSVDEPERDYQKLKPGGA